MSMKTAFAAALVAAFAIAGPVSFAAAQTSPAKEDTTKAKAATDRKAKAAARKAEKEAKAAEKKARAAEKKAAKTEKKGKVSDGRKAAQARQKQCGSEWKDVRAAGKIEKNMTWPKFYSACNKRLKEKAA